MTDFDYSEYQRQFASGERAVWGGGFCNQEGCPCGVPGPVCGEFMGSSEASSCIRCGWRHGEGVQQ